MAIEHEVWAKPPGGDQQSYQQSFDLNEWQWAEKLAQYLRDKGYEEVEVLLEVDVDFDEEEEDEEKETSGDEPVEA